MSAVTSCSTTTTGTTRKMSRRSPSSVQIWNPRPTTHISALYPEVMSMIFSYLDVTSKGRVSQVCSSWRESAYRKSVWRGVEAKLHLKPRSHCPTLFSSLLKRGIKKVQILSLQELKDVTQNMPNIETLVLSGCYNLKDCILGPAFDVTRLLNLTELNLSMCKKITDSSVHKICSSAPNLQRLDLGGCTSISNNCLYLIQLHLKQLLYLNLRSCLNITDDGIAKLCGQPISSHVHHNNDHKHPNRMNDEDDDDDVDDNEGDVVTEDEGLKHLQYLGLQDCSKLTDDALKHVSKGLKRLRSINLSFCANFTEFGLKYLSTMSSCLKEINLRSCDNVSDIGLRYLSEGGVSLHSLDISFCDKISDQGLDFLSQGLPLIRVLSLNSCSIGDDGLLKLSQTMTELRTLNIAQCSRVTDKGLNGIIDNCAHLKDLDVYGCTGITTPTIERLIQLNVNLSRELWPDTCFPHVSSNNTIAHLNLQAPKMHHESLPPTTTIDHLEILRNLNKRQQFFSIF